jgi:hypothetical protein
MSFVHKMVEMHPLFLLEWHAGKERIHDKTFAATYPTPQVNTTNGMRFKHTAQQMAQWSRLQQIIVQTLQLNDG